MKQYARENGKCSGKNRLLCMLSTVMALSLVLGALPLIGLADVAHPDKTSVAVGANDKAVKLTKAASWDHDHNKATVELTFNGIQNVYTETIIQDFIFILDNSGSMGPHADGRRFCENPKHGNIPNVSYSTLGINFTTDLLPVIEAAKTAGTFTPASIPADLLIEIPASLYPAGYTGGTLYLYSIAASMTETGVNNYKTATYWRVIDKTAATVADQSSSDSYDYHIDLTTKARIAVNANGYYGRFSDEINPVTNNPFWYDLPDLTGCSPIPARAEADAVVKFVSDTLAASPTSRFAVAMFATAARTGVGREALDFTTDSNAVKTFLETQFKNQGGATNYEAGFLSAIKILTDDIATGTGYPANNHKVNIIFVTDGVPNYIAKNGDMTVGDGLYRGDYAAQKAKYTLYHQLQKVYTDVSVNVLSFTVTDPIVLDYLSWDFVTYNSTYIGKYTAVPDFTGDRAKAFFDTFGTLQHEIVNNTKVVTITDLIDNEYYTVDTARLNANVDPLDSSKKYFYFPDYAKVKVELLDKATGAAAADVSVKTYQKVTFTYTVAPNGGQWNELESVRIPILLNPNADATGSVNYAPTNFDPVGSGGGATVTYIDLDKNSQTMNTERTWLPTGNVQLVKSDANTNGRLNGAAFKLFYSDGVSYSDTVYTTARSGANEGTVTKVTLPPGSYCFLETAAPAGYILPTGNDAKFAFDIADSAEAPIVVKTATNVPIGTVVTPPKTGDNSNIAGWMISMLLAVVGIMVTWKANKTTKRFRV